MHHFMILELRHRNYSSQPSMVHWLSSSIFPCSVDRCPSRYGIIFSSSTSSCPKPMHFLKAYDNSYSKMNKEHKYKNKDEYKENDKDKDLKRINNSVLYFRNPDDSSIPSLMVDTPLVACFPIVYEHVHIHTC